MPLAAGFRLPGEPPGSAALATIQNGIDRGGAPCQDRDSTSLCRPPPPFGTGPTAAPWARLPIDGAG